MSLMLLPSMQKKFHIDMVEIYRITYLNAEDPAACPVCSP